VSQPTERFSSRVENYIRYRPGYPSPLLDLLRSDCGLTQQSVIADIGSGTGKLTELLLNNGNKVFGVEPNEAMRLAGEQLLRNYPRFVSVAGSAESTTLPTASIDIATAAQAFHWFQPEKARSECARLLKPSGWAVLIWNDRQLQTTPFLRDYEQFLLDFGTDYNEVRHDKAEAAIQAFFAPNKFSFASFPNRQIFDYDGLRGRVLSSSYTPEPDHPTFAPMLRRLEELFQTHATDGQISFDYETKVFYGQLSTDRP
jgi:SAM-dependent methyltransferase